MTNPSLGGIDINLPVLLETRGLIQANSGGGKSHALRRLIEQTALGVQQIIIDPDGEFSTLREKFDFIICAPSGADAVATPATAAALALALWESGASAIVDIYELKAHERIVFVRRFLEALINAPKRMWHQTLVVLDEAHMFAPQTGQCESLSAVTDLATRGRKRGLCLVAATQRIAKLHKDVAAELLNKLIGRTGLDIDVKRAADELGMTAREALEQLRNLEPGEFYAFGPALHRTVIRTTIGKVTTTHPHTGQRLAIAPPPASAALKAKLANLMGLQTKAVEELKTVETLTAEVTKLRRELTIAQKDKPARPVGHTDEQVQALIAAERRKSQDELAKLTVPLAKIRDMALAALGEGFDAMTRDSIFNPGPPGKPSVFGESKDFGVVAIDARKAPPKPVDVDGAVTRPQQLILNAIAQLNAFGLAHPAKQVVAAHAGVSPKSSGFTNNLGALRTAGLIEYPGGGLVSLTDAGRAIAAHVGRPPTMSDLHESWLRILPNPQQAIVRELIARWPEAVPKKEFAESIGVSAASSGYTNNLGSLRTLGLLDYPLPGHVKATELLFPARAA